MDQKSTPQDDANKIPKHTTPTWELELLVSGATVFGLMQLPALADRVMFGLYNSSAPDVASLVLPLWVYAKYTVIMLIATFVAHLSLRGYWVALVGLYSVYPSGIRWDRMGKRMGPVLVETTRQASGDMDQIIERADNRASRVFGLGFGLAMTMLMPMVLVGGILVLIWSYRALGGTANILPAMGGLLLLLFLPYGLLMTWDRHRGASTPADHWQGRLLRRLFRFYNVFGFSRASNPLLSLFASNEGNRRTFLIIMLTSGVIVSLLFVQALAGRLGWDLGDNAGLPDDVAGTADALLPWHYASQRGEAVQLAPPPFIADPVVRGRYLRLFIPYLPVQHSPAMARDCPAALADTSDAGPRARLDCLSTMHALTIDGQPVSVPFDAGEDPATGQRGLVAMIPVRALAEGRHELVIRQPPREDAGEPGARAPRKDHRIPFWR